MKPKPIIYPWYIVLFLEILKTNGVPVVLLGFVIYFAWKTLPPMVETQILFINKQAIQMEIQTDILKSIKSANEIQVKKLDEIDNTLKSMKNE